MNERKVVSPGVAPDHVANPGMPNNPNLVGQPGQPSQGSVKLPGTSTISTSQTSSDANLAKTASPTPAAPAPQQPTVGQNPVQFNSAHIGSKTAQKQDPFAEQNQKAAIEKQKQTKTRNRGLIIGGIVLAVVVIVAITVAFFVIRNNATTPSEKNEETANDLYDEVMDKINASTPSATGPSSTDISDANVIFEDAISQATADNNTGEADALRVAQMLFYVNVGTNYSEMIRIGEEVQNIEALEPQQQLQYYNIMANAYTATGQTEKASEYYVKAGEASNKVNGLAPGEGDKGE